MSISLRILQIAHLASPTMLRAEFGWKDPKKKKNQMALGHDTKPQRGVRVNVGLTSAANIVSTGLDRAHHPLGLYNSTGDETL